MPQPTTKRRTGAKAPASRKRTTPRREGPGEPQAHHARRSSHDRRSTRRRSCPKRSSKPIEKSQRVAIESVRKFVDTVDHALPALPYSKGPSSRQEIVDSALEMADRLIHTQYDFIRKVIDSASKSLSGPDEPK